MSPPEGADQFVSDDIRPVGQVRIGATFLHQSQAQVFRGMIDTGAIHSIVSGLVLQRLGVTASGSRPVGVLGGNIVRSGLVWLTFAVSDGPPLEVQASVVSHIAPGIDALVGMDYLQNLRLTVWGGSFKVSPR